MNSEFNFNNKITALLNSDDFNNKVDFVPPQSFLIKDRQKEYNSFASYFNENFIQTSVEITNNEINYVIANYRYKYKVNKYKIEDIITPNAIQIEINNGIIWKALQDAQFKELDEGLLKTYKVGLENTKQKNFLFYFFIGNCQLLLGELDNAILNFGLALKKSANQNKQFHINFGKIFNQNLVEELTKKKNSGIKLDHFFIINADNSNEGEKSIDKLTSIHNSRFRKLTVFNTFQYSKLEDLVKDLKSSFSDSIFILFTGHGSQFGFKVFENGMPNTLTGDNIDIIISDFKNVTILDFVCSDKHFANFSYSRINKTLLIYSESGFSDSYSAEYYSFGFLRCLENGYNFNFAHLVGKFTVGLLSVFDDDINKKIICSDKNPT